MDTGIIILAHGSRGERGAVEVSHVLQRLVEGLKVLLPSDLEIIGASLQFNHPNMEEAVELLINLRVKSIIIAPYFLFPGTHLTEDIPHLIQSLKTRYPGRQFIATENLGLHEYFVEPLSRKIIDAFPDLLQNNSIAPGSPESIELQSMKIIEKLLPDGIDQDEKSIVKRIIHTSGDPGITHLVKFSPSAIDSGREALAKGCTIFTDVTMVSSGIRKKLAEKLSCSVICALNKYDGVPNSKTLTRSASSLYSLKEKITGSIFAIGNAPTALLALLDMIDNENIKPALVIGMPVGFVMARESKSELMKRNVPYITITGTRGGSTLAAATINALLQMTILQLEKKQI
jgi:precorrin-8X/cobalt-precorrin-8 methylmutase